MLKSKNMQQKFPKTPSIYLGYLVKLMNFFCKTLINRILNFIFWLLAFLLTTTFFSKRLENTT
jgi:hypothetical protein